MTYFTCKINMDNEAFENPEHLRELLLEIAEEVQLTGRAPVVDSNGNKVGEWEIVERVNQ